MEVATPASYSLSGCGAPTFTPVAGASSISFSNGTIVAGGTCFAQVSVTAPITGVYTNTTGIVSANIAGNGNSASDPLTVTSSHPGISILKQVSATGSDPWTSFLAVPVGDSVYYRFIVENTGDVILNNVSVTDPAFTMTDCSWEDGK